MQSPIAIPCFKDNYIWMLHDGTQAVVVDPGDAAPVLQALDGVPWAEGARQLLHAAPPSADFSRRSTSHKCSRSRSNRPLTVSGTARAR